MCILVLLDAELFKNFYSREVGGLKKANVYKMVIVNR